MKYKALLKSSLHFYSSQGSKINTLSHIQSKFRPIKDSKLFSKVSFDELTHNIKFYKEQFEEKEKEKIERTPWNFQAEKKVIEDQNLKGIVDYNQILSHEKAESLFLGYFEGYQKMDVSFLSKFTENRFCSNLRRHFARQKENSMKIVSKKDPLISDISLYNVKSIIGIGVSKNRKNNMKIEQFRLFDNHMGETPVQIIFKKKRGKDENVKVFFQFQLAITCETQLSLINPSFEIEKEEGVNTHFMDIETCIMELPYKTWKKTYLSIDHVSSIFTADCKIHQDPEIYIIDFDFYMQGNPFVSF